MKKKITTLLVGIFALVINTYAQIAPTVTFTVTPSSACVGSPVTITSTTTGSTPILWTWYLAGSSISYDTTSIPPGNPPSFTYYSAGTYTIICVVKNGTFPNDSVIETIQVGNPPTAMVEPPSGGICDTANRAALDTIYFSFIDTTKGNTYSWAPSSSLSCSNCERPYATPTVTTVYTITVTGASGCTITLTDTVTVGPITAKISGNSTSCAGWADGLVASGGSNNKVSGPTTYQWNNGATTSSITVTPNITTTYNVLIFSGLLPCSSSAVFTVNVSPIPTFTITSPDSICNPSKATISVLPGLGDPYEYIWFGPTTPPDTTANYVTSPTVTTTYTLQVQNDFCVIDSLVKIKVNNPPVVHFTGATDLCQGSSTTICASGGDQYQWGPPAYTTACINVTPPLPGETYTVQVRSGACFKDTSFTVVVDTMPKIGFKGDTSICIGDIVGTTIYALKGYGYTYLWSTGSTADSVYTGIISSGETFYLTVSKGACSKDSAEVTVKVYPRPKPVIYPIDTTVCEYDSVTLTAAGGDYYTWTPKNSGLDHYLFFGDTDRNGAAPAVTTVYSVSVCTWGCCKDTSVTVNITPNVQGATVCCNDTVSAGTPVNLSATFSPGPYFVSGWSPSNGLSCTNCADPTATVNNTTTYVVTFADLNGCTVQDSVTIDIFNCNVFVPNAFSPNGDGIDDILYVRSLCLKSMDFAVFDRWGNKVFETVDLNDGWNGIYRGKDAVIGTYMWYLTGLLNDGTHISKSGNVTLVR